MNWDWAMLIMSPFLILYGVVGFIGHHNRGESFWAVLSGTVALIWTLIFLTSLLAVL